MQTLVTGATGFVGKALSRRLGEDGHIVIPAVRQAAGLSNEVTVGNIGPSSNWTSALAGCDAVVHLAARVHIMHEKAKDPLSLYRATNTDGTLNLARQAAAAGVRRFVFVSTIKVNGEGSKAPYRESDVPAPEDAYATSKWEAEQGLLRIASESSLEVVILRPPLIYGPGVKANFHRLTQVIRRGWPLPLGAIDNRRSLLYLGNMIDAICACLAHPAASGKTFLLDDGAPISTPDLIRAMAQAMRRPARLLDVPVPLLRGLAALAGRSAAIDRLAGSLFVDSTSIRSDLDWTPPFSMESGLKATLEAP